MLTVLRTMAARYNCGLCVYPLDSGQIYAVIIPDFVFQWKKRFESEVGITTCDGVERIQIEIYYCWSRYKYKGFRGRSEEVSCSWWIYPRSPKDYIPWKFRHQQIDEIIFLVVAHNSYQWGPTYFSRNRPWTCNLKFHPILGAASVHDSIPWGRNLRNGKEQ